MASGGKDREVRVWRLECLEVGSGNTEALRGLSSVMGCRAQPDRKNTVVHDDHASLGLEQDFLGRGS